ncbi:hypothetical protein MLD38_025276 [Melastoma candidum]|uniref:Uncharacterized protein n=1 Tax=Melastoma candidum TaxID=119954 RepID=A0ACB9NXZ1_9MYRT|nr:hypothetical protein MLD38_025276 [Melastoma candidum]
MASTVAGRCAFMRAMAMAVAVANNAALPERLVLSEWPEFFRPAGYHGRISSSRLVRRELSSLLPTHSAVASACLVSKLRAK